MFYPDLIDPYHPPSYRLDPDPQSKDTVIIRFCAGPPYEDIGFRIVKDDWDYSYKKGFKYQFDRGVLQLWFRFKRDVYKR